jgi:hypothetical protein
MTSGTFHGRIGAAAARRASFEPTAVEYDNSAEFARHVRAASGGAVPLAVFHREPGPGVVYANISASCALQPRPDAGHGVVLVDLLPDGAEHGESFVGQLPSGGVAAYDDYALQPRPGARHVEVLVDLLPDGAGHGEVFVDMLPGGGVDLLRDPNLSAVYDNRSMVAEHLRRLLVFAGIGA